MLNDFCSFYFQALAMNIMIYLALGSSFTWKIEKFKVYSLVFVFSNIQPITDTLAIVFVGEGYVQYTQSVYWILKICIILQQLVMVIFIVLVADGKWYRYFWWGVILQMVMVTINVAAYSIKYIQDLNGRNVFVPINFDTLPVYLMGMIVIIFVGAICMIVSKIVIKRLNLSYLSKWIWRSIYTVWGGVVLISNKSYGNGNDKILSRMDNFRQVAVFIAFALIILFITINRTERKLLKVENELLKKQNEIQYANYMAMQQQDFDIHKLYHDIGNHLETMQILINEGDNEEAKNYAENLMFKYRNIKKNYFCENKIINAVLLNKLKVCDQQEIPYSLEIKVPELLSIEDIDLMSVFTNLLDNAIEGCLRGEVHKRYVEIKAAIIGNYLSVKVVNNKQKVVVYNTPAISTWKKEKHLHGYGMKILDEIKEKYDGKLEYQDQGDSFSALVLLKI